MNLGVLGYPSDLTQAVIDDKTLIVYRPRLNQITGGVLPTILLQQIIYWANKNSNLFYKFMRPCNHELYRPGDSWEEELGFSRRELDGSLKCIAKKYNPKREEVPTDSFIVFYTDIRRLTWYSVNWNRLNAAIESAFIRNVQNDHYVKHDAGITYGTDRTLPIKDTENTTENKQQTSRAPAPAAKSETAVDVAAVSFLERYGIPRDKASAYAAKFSLVFIQRKMREIEVKFLQGSISNLQGYVISVFERTESEASQFEREQEQQKEMTQKQKKEAEILECKKQQQEERRHQEFLSITDKLMAEANVVELRWFADWLKGENSQAYAMYKDRGLKGYIVETYYRRYLYNKYYKID